MKLRLLCLLVLSLFVFSACSSEAVKDNETASGSQSPSESASEPPGVSENNDLYHEYILEEGPTQDVKFVDKIPEESVNIRMKVDYTIGKTVIVSDGEKELYIENRSYNDVVLKTNMKLFSYCYSLSGGDGGVAPMSHSLECYVEPSESYTLEGSGQVTILSPGQRPFKANVKEKIVVSSDTVTVYGADKENPDFKDKEERSERKIVFAE